jgi:hypothetical protein
MYILTQKSGQALLIRLISRIISLEKLVASWTNADVMKKLYKNAPEHSAVSHIYYKRYLELAVPESLAIARSCRNRLELQTLINNAEFKSDEQEAYAFIMQSERFEQDAFAKEKAYLSEKDARILFESAEEDSAEQVIYELKWLDFHLQSPPLPKGRHNEM